MKHGKWSDEDIANQILRLLRRISELEAAEIERQRAEQERCQLPAEAPRGAASGAI